MLTDPGKRVSYQHIDYSGRPDTGFHYYPARVISTYLTDEGSLFSISIAAHYLENPVGIFCRHYRY
jgi:hypothetical protein